MREDTSIEQHLKHMKELTDRLAAMGAPITEEDQVVMLLGSLPKSYSTFVTSQEARENVLLNYLQQALVHEEQKRHGQEHFKNADMQKRDAALVGESRKNFKPRKPICFGCQQPGHFQRYCPKVKRGLSHKAETADERAEDLELTGAFAASTNSSQAETWLVDSWGGGGGASSHMTWDKELLTKYHEFETREKVGLGDGRPLDALGVGDVHFKMLFKGSQPKTSIMYRVLYVPQLAYNLFSVRAATSKGNLIKFGHS